MRSRKCLFSSPFPRSSFFSLCFFASDACSLLLSGCPFHTISSQELAAEKFPFLEERFVSPIFFLSTSQKLINSFRLSCFSFKVARSWEIVGFDYQDSKVLNRFLSTAQSYLKEPNTIKIDSIFQEVNNALFTAFSLWLLTDKETFSVG